jgi:hypothetical protein
MDKTKSTMAQQIAEAAVAFEQRRAGNYVPKSVTVVLSEGTLVITLHDALSPAEKEMAKTSAGAGCASSRGTANPHAPAHRKETDMHTLTLNDNERTLLIAVLEAFLSKLPHEIHQTDKREYRDMLEGKQSTLEQMLKRLQAS